MLTHWRHVHEMTGLPFVFSGSPMQADGFIYDTEPACRAVVTARHLNASAALELLHAIQRACYAEGRDVTLPSVLAQIAGGCGLNEAAFTEAFHSLAMKEATRDDIALTQRVGVTGFPTLCVDAGDRLQLINAGYVKAEAIEGGLQRLAENADQEPTG
jgi:putative protein-disulfide isomerase